MSDLVRNTEDRVSHDTQMSGSQIAEQQKIGHLQTIGTEVTDQWKKTKNDNFTSF